MSTITKQGCPADAPVKPATAHVAGKNVSSIHQTFSWQKKSPEEILRQRAKELASPPPLEKADTSSSTLQVVTFKIGDELYALESRFVQEVIPAREITQIPGTPEFILGIINLRGVIYSIIDLPRFMGLTVHSSSFDSILLLKFKDMEFGLATEGIQDVTHIVESSLSNQLCGLFPEQQKYLKSITSDSIIILDGEKLLTDKRLVIDTTSPISDI